MRIIKLTEDTLQMRKELLENFELMKTTTGISGIDNAFGFLVKGSIYAVASATGVGKTTFLLATAKEMANKGYKVLYLSIEMNVEQLIPYLPEIQPNLTVQEFDGTSWDKLDGSEYDIICYDYIGANLNDWDELIIEADNLAEYAKKHNIVIFTALQARPEIAEETKEENLHTNVYVAFSKGMINKVAGAAYLVKRKQHLYLYVMKNRYRPVNWDPIEMSDLDYATKSWLPRW